MRRRALFTSPGYATCATGVVLVGAIALLLTSAYPVIEVIVLIAMLVALGGIGQRWHRHVRRQRKRAAQGQTLQI